MITEGVGEDMLDFAELFRRNGRYPEKLLDVGGGLCQEGEQILARSIFLTGIDQDGETIRNVQKRLPQGKFAAAEAALWMENQHQKFDAILIRRPDVIFRSKNWRRIFRKLQTALSENGRVAVTTPGMSEAKLCERWLQDMAVTVERSATGMAEEEFIVTAEDFRQPDRADGTADNRQTSLIQSLVWEDDQPHMVCDLRTGKCTMAAGGENPKSV